MQDSNKRELASPGRTRRTFTKQFKADLVAQANSGTVSVSQLAIDHRINTNQLRKWIADAKRKSLPAILPVSVNDEVAIDPTTLVGRGMIEMNMDGVVLRFHSGWDPQVVATLIKACR